MGNDEIIDGEHFVTPSPNTKHQAVSTNLAAILWTYLQEHPIGAVFAAPLDVVFSDFDVVEPDILYMVEGPEVIEPPHRPKDSTAASAADARGRVGKAGGARHRRVS